MKLTKFKEKENTKKYIILGVIPILVIVLVLVVYSYSFYQKEDEVIFANGKVGDFNLDDNIYGVKRSIDTSSSAWERIDDSVGLVARATKDGTEVVNDFDNIYPWSEIKSYNYDTGTQQITAWYGEEGFTFTPSGNIEVLTYIPEFYYKRIQEDGYEYVYISKEFQSVFSKSEAFSIGRYTMSGNSSRVHSRSGSTPLTNKTITEFRSYATNLGEGFQQLDYHYFIIQLLYLVEYADYNSQAVLGLGFTDSSNTAPTTSGGCDTLGMKSGTLNNDGKHSIIYRGIEDIYGSVFQYVDGINVKNKQIYINYNPETYEVNKYDGDYILLAYIGGNQGYISKLGYDAENQLIALPIEASGSDVNYITDGIWINNANDVIAGVGGGSYGYLGGIWHWILIDGSMSYSASRGARLLKT